MTFQLMYGNSKKKIAETEVLPLKDDVLQFITSKTIHMNTYVILYLYL